METLIPSLRHVSPYSAFFSCSGGTSLALCWAVWCTYTHTHLDTLTHHFLKNWISLLFSCLLFFKIFILLIIYLAVLGLSCSTGDLQSSLQHVRSLVAACELLVAACGIQFPNQGSNLSPLHWELGVLDPGPPGKALIHHSSGVWMYSGYHRHLINTHWIY